MKGLSLIQPYASLVAIGAKGHETRSWQTKHRGELAIHASKDFPGYARDTVFVDPFYEVLHAAGLADITVRGLIGVQRLPQGAIVAVVNVLCCLPTELYDNPPYCHMLGPHERDFGEWAPGRWAWQLADIQVLAKPVPCWGRLGVWNVPPEVEAAVRAQL